MSLLRFLNFGEEYKSLIHPVSCLWIVERALENLGQIPALLLPCLEKPWARLSSLRISSLLISKMRMMIHK